MRFEKEIKDILYDREHCEGENRYCQASRTLCIRKDISIYTKYFYRKRKVCGVKDIMKLIRHCKKQSRLTSSIKLQNLRNVDNIL